MAGAAFLSQAAIVEIIVLVTAITCCRGALIDIVDMACAAGYAGVDAGQFEGCLVVVKIGTTPG